MGIFHCHVSLLEGNHLWNNGRPVYRCMDQQQLNSDDRIPRLFIQLSSWSASPKCDFDTQAARTMKIFVLESGRNQQISGTHTKQPTKQNCSNFRFYYPMTSIGRKDPLEKMSGKLQAISCAHFAMQKNTVDGSEIPNNHLGCTKTRKSWDKLSINWCRISEPSTETVPKKSDFHRNLSFIFSCKLLHHQDGKPPPNREIAPLHSP